jgi:type I restriction enzyme S subunit
MTELPNGWEWSTLSEACDVVQDCEHRTPKYAEDGIPALRPRDVVGGRLDISTAARVSESEYELQTRRYMPAPGDIVYSRELSLGWAATLPATEVCLSQGMVAMKPGSALVSDYLSHFLNGPGRASALAAQAGSAHPHLNLRDIRAMPIAVAPRAEQERIVRAIDEAFAKLDAGDAGLQAVRQLLKRTRDAILAAAVTGRLLPQDPTDTCATKLLADLGVEATPGNLPELPDGWAWATVEAVGKIDLGRQRHPDWHLGPNMKPYLRVANVFDDRIDNSDLKEMHFDPEVFERFRLSPGDVLLNEGQTPELLGRPAVYRGDPPEVAFTNSIIRFRASAGVSADYSLLVFRHYMRSGRFTREARITTNIAHLSVSRLKPIEFPLPPTEEQRRIAEEVERQMSFIEACERSVDAGLGVSAALRRSVLKAAFEGRLVPQDPTDVPASVLLDQVRADRAAHPNLKKRRATTTA